MNVHVCYNDGAALGEFMEADFRDKIFAGEITSDCFYWYEGMEDWKPVAEYRALAKTQRITIVDEPLPTHTEDPVMIAPKPNDGWIKGLVVGAVGAGVIGIGLMSNALIVEIIGGVIILFGIYLAVADRLRA